MNRGLVPAEPIRCGIEKWMDDYERAGGVVTSEANLALENVRLTPLQAIIHAIWGFVPTKRCSEYRIMYRLLDRRPGGIYRERKDRKGSYFQSNIQEGIGFDLADQILCKLDLVHLWLEDPVLREAYLSVDLAYVDQKASLKAAA